MDKSDSSNQDLCKELFATTSMKLNIASQKENRFNLVCLSLVFTLFISQYYFFIGYTPINPNEALLFIEVPKFNPLLGMSAYLACTLFFLFSYPRSKVGLVKKFHFSKRTIRESNSLDELQEFASEASKILAKRKQIMWIQSVIVLIVGLITASLIFLSHNLHNHVQLHNDLGSAVSKIDNTQDRLKLIDSNIAEGLIPSNLKGYYYNQIMYMEAENQLASNKTVSLGLNDDSKYLAIAILQGQHINIVLDKKQYLENLSTWTTKSPSGKYQKNLKREFNGLFLHNQEPLLILGNYLSKN